MVQPVPARKVPYGIGGASRQAMFPARLRTKQSETALLRRLYALAVMAAPLRQSSRYFAVTTLKFASTLAVLALLTACSSNNDAAPACPLVAAPGDVAKITRFRDGPGRDLIDVVAEAQIADAAVQCDYDRSGVTVQLQLAILGTRGPADTSRTAAFDYFVAIADPQGTIVAKEIFPVSFSFENRQRVGQIENLEQRIPLANRADGAAYKIVVGFQLSPAELEWNRRAAR